MKHYQASLMGINFGIRYPDFLRIYRREPEWFAADSGFRTSVLIRINPSTDLCDAFSDLLSDSHFDRAVGVKIEQQGTIETSNAIIGRHKLSSLADATGKIQSWGWLIEGRLMGQTIHVQMNIAPNDWRGGNVWRDMLSSIQIIDPGHLTDS